MAARRLTVEPAAALPVMMPPAHQPYLSGVLKALKFLAHEPNTPTPVPPIGFRPLPVPSSVSTIGPAVLTWTRGSISSSEPPSCQYRPPKDFCWDGDHLVSPRNWRPQAAQPPLVPHCRRNAPVKMPSFHRPSTCRPTTVMKLPAAGPSTSLSSRHRPSSHLGPE